MYFIHVFACKTVLTFVTVWPRAKSVIEMNNSINSIPKKLDFSRSANKNPTIFAVLARIVVDFNEIKL